MDFQRCDQTRSRLPSFSPPSNGTPRSPRLFDSSINDSRTPLEAVEQEVMSDIPAQKAAEVDYAREKARATFDYSTFRPPGTVSRFVCETLGVSVYDINRFLACPTNHSSNNHLHGPRAEGNPSTAYDFVRFKTDKVDELWPRQVLHHDIAFAMRKQAAAELKMERRWPQMRTNNTEERTVLYAVGDAQIILLLDCLTSRDEQCETFHDPSKFNVSDKFILDLKSGQTIVEKHVAAGAPYYIREINDESIYEAFRALTAPCAMFCIGKKKMCPKEPEAERISNEAKENADTNVAAEEEDEAPRKKGRRPKNTKKGDEAKEPVKPKQHYQKDYTFEPFQACVFFEDKVDENGDLAFDTEVMYFPLPYNELPPGSIIREEALEMEAEEAQSEMVQT